ncbi:hypothetical protein BTUL_0120g00160 [Botrytis tulipae]|uniref:Uncharacterized protein n=1 Tax=Botrytis tulipae TaxID=87230 RepID=A0A4Z1EK77_9HELO|nr:hypothetical protein BTUL_0120g00160 [Botrytis tulipae]
MVSRVNIVNITKNIHISNAHDSEKDGALHSPSYDESGRRTVDGSGFSKVVSLTMTECLKSTNEIDIY